MDETDAVRSSAKAMPRNTSVGFFASLLIVPGTCLHTSIKN